ncbi:MAG: 2-C-methyl-D-erythritol 4-phosphate cytidylyltransferase, partial [Sphingomonas sp.]|nr:2-C-methyl-D-erythritol 4-phosphate cytidylyltransferase [Sphingomonas sp.]
MSISALIVAAGSGSRMGGHLPKQYRPIGGLPVIAHAVDALASHPSISTVRVVIGGGQEEHALKALGGRDVGPLVHGGLERSDSVRAGLSELDDDIVLVHDAARPFCPHDVIDRLLAALDDRDGAVPVLPVADTLARANADLGEPVERAGLVRVQTPQAFRRSLLVEAYEQWAGPAPTAGASR